MALRVSMQHAKMMLPCSAKQVKIPPGNGYCLKLPSPAAAVQQLFWRQGCATCSSHLQHRHQLFGNSIKPGSALGSLPRCGGNPRALHLTPIRCRSTIGGPQQQALCSSARTRDAQGAKAQWGTTGGKCRTGWCLFLM